MIRIFIWRVKSVRMHMQTKALQRELEFQQETFPIQKKSLTEVSGENRRTAALVEKLLSNSNLLTEEEKQILTAIITDYNDLFILDSNDKLGYNDWIPVEIQLEIL